MSQEIKVRPRENSMRNGTISRNIEQEQATPTSEVKKLQFFNQDSKHTDSFNMNDIGYEIGEEKKLPKEGVHENYMPPKPAYKLRKNDSRDTTPGGRQVTKLDESRNYVKTLKNLEAQLSGDLEPNYMGNGHDEIFESDRNGNKSKTNGQTDQSQKDREYSNDSPIDQEKIGHVNSKKVAPQLKRVNKESGYESSSDREDSGTGFQAKKQWSKLSNVFKSINLFRNEDVKSIEPGDILDEIQQFNLRKWNDQAYNKNDLSKQDFARDAFQLVRRVQVFCGCAQVGSDKHIKVMKEILDDDPKKMIYSPSDPNHILNKLNENGFSPMYIAAKNGNTKVLELLLERGANPEIQSIIDPIKKTGEYPIQVAVFWNHFPVVELFMEHKKYSFKIWKSCLKIAQNPKMKNLIKNHLKKEFPGKGLGLFSCFG